MSICITFHVAIGYLCNALVTVPDIVLYTAVQNLHAPRYPLHVPWSEELVHRSDIGVTFFSPEAKALKLSLPRSVDGSFVVLKRV
jgi:hypothetical protein